MNVSDVLAQIIGRIDDKTDKLDSRLDDIVGIQIKQEENLRQHMERTAIAEENLSILKSRIEPLEERKKNVDVILNIFIWCFSTAVSTGILTILVEKLFN